MYSEQEIREIFVEQAGWCNKLGSPFTAQLLMAIGEILDRSTRCGAMVFDWSGQPDAKGDALALRIAGALNGIVRAGRSPELAALYPPNPRPLPKKFHDVLVEAFQKFDNEICERLTFAPQTNEVARSAILYPGMGVIAQKSGLPLSLYELGSSAGLNLMMDKFSYQFDSRNIGEENSKVHLSPIWKGPLPKIKKMQVVNRNGCDLNPLNIADAEHRARLLAYVWPDQSDRLARTKAAIKIALTDPPKIKKSDAADWVEDVIRLDGTPVGGTPVGGTNGTTRVLFHSIAYQYFPEVARKRITDRMEMAGARATLNTPLAWLAFEQVATLGSTLVPTLTLRFWKGDKNDGETKILAKANNAHVQEIEWFG